MGYSEQLDAMARLHVDTRFRDTFRTNPEAALASLGLTPAEQGALARLPPAVFELIGGLSEFHRVARIQEHAPWMDVTLRPDLGPRVERYLAQVTPKLLNRDEAIAFCRFIEADLPLEPPYLGELARCERLRLSMAWGLEPALGAGHVEALEYPIPRILQAFADAPSAEGWPEAPPEPTRLEFKKVPGLPAVLLRTLGP